MNTDPRDALTSPNLAPASMFKAPALVLVVETVVQRPYRDWDRDERGLPITADVVGESRIVADEDVLLDYLVTHKGLTPERAALVIYRRCQFSIEPAEGATSRRYRVEAGR